MLFGNVLIRLDMNEKWIYAPVTSYQQVILLQMRPNNRSIPCASTEFYPPIKALCRKAQDSIFCVLFLFFGFLLQFSYLNF